MKIGTQKAKALFGLTLAVAGGGLLLSPDARAQVNWIYNTGYNYVNMTGSSCRARSTDENHLVQHWSGKSYVSYSTSTSKSVYCPFNRRGTGRPHTNSTDKKALRLNVQSMTIHAQEYNSSGEFRCSPFATNPTGSKVWASTKYLCDSTDGCGSGTRPGLNWTGKGKIKWQVPLLAGDMSNADIDLGAVNWGLWCNAGPGSTINYHEATVSPNF